MTIQPTPSRLAMAGRLAMVSALLAVPWFILTFALDEKAGEAVRLIQFIVLVVGTGLLIFLMTTLRILLRQGFAYRRADAPIVLLVTANVASALMGGTAILFPEAGRFLDIAGLALVVATGAVQILFGVRLLRLPDNLRGMLRPFCYLNIATGVLLTTVLLLPVGVVTSAIADVMLGTIFLQAAREATENETKGNA
ncbi:MAG TPA: hypothetical protein VI389_10615 [Geobacteraceae bacterium]